MPGIIRRLLNRGKTKSITERSASSVLCQYFQKKQWRKAQRFVAELDESELDANVLHCLLEMRHSVIPIALVCALIQLKPNIVTHRNEEGRYPVHCALMCRCSLEIVELLTNAFPDALTEKDENGQTPLHVACLYGNISFQIINLLCNASPDSLVIEDGNGATPMEVSITREYADNIEVESMQEIDPESLQMLHEFTGMYIDWKRKTNRGKMPCQFERADTIKTSGSLFDADSAISQRF